MGMCVWCCGWIYVRVVIQMGMCAFFVVGYVCGGMDGYGCDDMYGYASVVMRVGMGTLAGR